MDIMANSLLAAGASPAMVHAFEEIAYFTHHAKGLCINIGTLTPDCTVSMKAAAAKAAEAQNLWVLDPAAAGAFKYRMNRCLELVDLKPTVIRGNASEILALAGASIGSAKQWRSNSKTNMNYARIEPDKNSWGWSWLERWMAAKLWENRLMEQAQMDACEIQSLKSYDDAGENLRKSHQPGKVKVRRNNISVRVGE